MIQGKSCQSRCTKGRKKMRKIISFSGKRGLEVIKLNFLNLSEFFNGPKTEFSCCFWVEHSSKHKGKWLKYIFFQYRFLLHFHLSQYKLRVVTVNVLHLKTAQSKSGSLIYGKICSLSAGVFFDIFINNYDYGIEKCIFQANG